MTNYNSQGFKDDKSRSKMYQNGKMLAEQAKNQAPEKESFFKMSLKAAIRKAFKTVVKPTFIRFVDDVFEDTKNSLLYGDSRRTPDGRTNYRQISSGPSRLHAPYREAPKMTNSDHQFQRYDLCRVDTEEQAIEILNSLYKKYRAEGRIKLAYYYELFGEKFTFQDECWGWTSMNGADAEQTSTGYRVIMPKLEELL